MARPLPISNYLLWGSLWGFGSQESPRRAGTALYFSCVVCDGLAVGGGGSDFQAPYQQEETIHIEGAEKGQGEAFPSAECY